MAEVSARELRNNAADLLRRAQAGERIVISTYGVPAAELVPIRARRRASIPRSDLIAMLQHPADPGLRSDLEAMDADTTDDLRPTS